MVSVTHDDTKIISSSSNGSIKVGDTNLRSDMLVQEWTYERPSYPVAISPNDQLIVVTGGSNMVIYTMQGTWVNTVAIIELIQSMAHELWLIASIAMDQSGFLGSDIEA